MSEVKGMRSKEKACADLGQRETSIAAAVKSERNGIR